MPLYRYVKDQKRFRLAVPRGISLTLMSIGFGIILWTLWPIISFWATDTFFVRTISPVSEGSLGQANAPVVYASADGNTDRQEDTLSDANTWFPTKPQTKVVSPVNTYTISIPKLKIENATVTVAGDDLGVSLVHYGGTGLPGQYGNTVIFGHSTLPQFYNPKKYKTIFSLLPTLEIGDMIYIEYDGIRYDYMVYDKVVVDPTDLSPLEQKFDDSYVTLVTCVPPGTYWKRLNIKAKLEKSR